MASETHELICTFCSEVKGLEDFNLFYELGVASQRSDYVLLETEHFVVIPCVGALTDWYLLVVSKRHVLSVGWLEDDERSDLKDLLSKLGASIEFSLGHEVAMFEHGTLSFRDKGGACYDHCHIHVVVTEKKVAGFLAAIPPEFAMRSTLDWIDDARQMIARDERAYLAAASADMQLIGSAAGAPSQFFRRALASWLGDQTEEWDAALFPQKDRLTQMIAKKHVLDAI